MPVIRSARKKLRQDKKKEDRNDLLRKLLSQTVKKTKKTITEKSLRDSFSVIDKAAKKNLIHKNKAANIKSALSKLLKSPAKTKSTEKSTTPKTKKTSRSSSVKK